MDDFATLVTHANCPDGIASALIVRDVYPSIRVVAVGYDDEREQFPAEPGMLFVDMSPPEARVQEFVDAGAVVMDHHKTARAVVEAFGKRGLFGDEVGEPGVCGAVLAYRHLWKAEGFRGTVLAKEAIEEFTRLAGIRDTWHKDSPDWERSCKLAELLRFLGMDKALEMGLDEVIRMQGWLGDHLWGRKTAAARRAAKRAHITRVGPHMVGFLPSIDTISDASEFVDAAFIVGFAYEGPGRLVVSLRSRGGVDVGKIAETLGGGGHSGAAGFRCTTPGDDPYHALVDMLFDVAALGDM